MPQLTSLRTVLIAAALGASSSGVGAQVSDPRPSRDTAAARAVAATIDSIEAAARRRDRSALERLYAREFVFVHGQRGVVTRSEQLLGMLTRDTSSGRMLRPPLDSIHVFGDAAIIRMHRSDTFFTTVFVKRAGYWQIAQTQTTLLAARPIAVADEERRLSDYLGRFARPDTYVDVTGANDTLFVQRAAGMRLPVTPIGKDAFQDRFGGKLLFERDSAGRITSFLYQPAIGEERRWTKAPPNEEL